MKKNFFVLAILVVTTMFFSSLTYAITKTYNGTLPIFQGNVTLSQADKTASDQHAHNYINTGELDPDCYIWFDFYAESIPTWFRACDTVLQNEGTSVQYNMWVNDDLDIGDTLRLRAKATGWGLDTYEISGTVNFH